jgi:hypothetical protein
MERIYEGKESEYQLSAGLVVSYGVYLGLSS